VSSASMRRSVAPGRVGLRLVGIGDWKEYLSGGAATSAIPALRDEDLNFSDVLKSVLPSFCTTVTNSDTLSRYLSIAFNS
jgi:hypothetical protein